MCGIAGYKYGTFLAPTVLLNMVESLRHRGPDSKGFYQDKDFHGGMRRLSINDIEGGGQPLFNKDKTVVLLYNGEIYNSQPALMGRLSVICMMNSKTVCLKN